MVERVPRETAYEEARFPAHAAPRSLRRDLPARRGSEPLEHGLPRALELRAFIVGRRRPEAPAEPAEVSRFGVAHVSNDRVDAPPATARSGSQSMAARRLDGSVEGTPTGAEQRAQPIELRVVERSPVGAWRHGGRAEIRRRITRKPLGHAKQRRISGRVEAQARAGQDRRVARGAGEERFERARLIAAAAAPSRPLDRAREGAFGARLEGDRDRRARPARAPLRPGAQRWISGRQTSKRRSTTRISSPITTPKTPNSTMPSMTREVSRNCPVRPM